MDAPLLGYGRRRGLQFRLKVKGDDAWLDRKELGITSKVLSRFSVKEVMRLFLYFIYGITGGA